MYKENDVEITKPIAGLMLSAILSDTLIFRSPTTTEDDIAAGKDLAKIAGVDYEAYGMEMFKAGTSLEGYSIEEIVNMDFKAFDMGSKKVGIGQVMTLDIDSVLSKKDEYLDYINSTDYDMLYLALYQNFLYNLNPILFELFYKQNQAVILLVYLFLNYASILDN